MYNEYYIYIGVFFRVIALIPLLTFILPTQYQEAKIKDGIFNLRRQLFGLGMVITGTIILTILFNFGRLITHQEFFSSQLIFLNSIADLAIGIMLFIIYSKKYIEEGGVRNE